MKRLDDIQLVTRVAVFNDKRAFDRLVVKYQGSIRRFFMNHTLGDEQLSDDLAQDTFVKAYTNIRQFRELASFSSWLYRIAFNVFYDYRRRHKDTEDIEARTPEHTAGGDNSGIKIDIYKAMTLLNDNERTCVTLKLVDGMSIEKIAEITGINAGTVKSHVSRGRHKLAEYLKQNGYDRR